MKKIEAIVRLSQFDRIRDELAKIGVNFFTLTEVKGFGLQKGKQMVYRGSVYDSDYIARLRLDILCATEKVDAIIETIVKAGRTGEIGDGKIIVTDVEYIVRIRSGETNEEAI